MNHKDPLKLVPIESPFANLTVPEREQLMRDVVAGTSERIDDLFKSLTSAMKGFDPVHIITLASSYMLVVPAGKDGLLRNEGRVKNFQPVIELLQALALSIPPREVGKNLAPPEEFGRIYEDVQELYELLFMQPFELTNIGVDGFYSRSNDLRILTQMYRGGVRNWGYYGQVKRICQSLYSRFDNDIEEQEGYSLTNVIDLFSELIQYNERYLSERMKKLSAVAKADSNEELARAYIAHFELDEDNLHEVLNWASSNEIERADLLLVLLGHSDTLLVDSCFHEFEELSEKLGMSVDSLKRICSEFGFEFGSLQSFDSHEFILENPIWKRPLIHFENGVFCAIPQVFFSFVIPSLERVIKKFNPSRLSKARSKYLESRVFELIDGSFKDAGATIVPGFRWVDDGNRYECDLILQLDSVVLIIEAKSHQISSSALRGAPQRMKRHIKEVVVDPSMQSLRLETLMRQLIQSEGDSEQFLDAGIDLSAISRVIRVSVSLEDFSVVHGCLHLLEEGEWVPDGYKPCPAMTLADLETVLDLLNDPVHILTYLSRRAELVSNIKLFGDELDFLGLYLENLLNVEGELDNPEAMIMLSGVSRRIDNYYESADHGIKIEKPEPLVEVRHQRILSQLMKRRPAGWLELCMILLRLTPLEQKGFYSKAGIFARIVDKRWRWRHKNIVIFRPNNSDGVIYAMVLHKSQNASKRDEFINSAFNHAFSEEGVTACMVIAVNIDDKVNPYSYISLGRRPVVSTN